MCLKDQKIIMGGIGGVLIGDSDIQQKKRFARRVPLDWITRAASAAPGQISVLLGVRLWFYVGVRRSDEINIKLSTLAGELNIRRCRSILDKWLEYGLIEKKRYPARGRVRGVTIKVIR